MKIIRLTFENINNLKGKHCIDFEAEPLVNADIFAIIGATGSGKSTILDVITLALFNKTPRFSKISKKSLTDEGSIITRNEKKAEAKITYRVKNKEYTSVWNIEYNRNNNLNEYHMEIISDGKPLDLKRSEVPKKNAEIIGLDYEQFTKAIILSQGEFSKFLKADINERSVLLEKITGTSIYRELGIKTHEIHREKKSELEQNEQILKTIVLLSEDEIKALNEQQKQLNSDLIKQKKVLEKVSINLQRKKDFISIENQLKNLKERQKENIEKSTHFLQKLEKLNLHKKVVPFRKELEDFTKKEDAIQKNKIQLERYRSSLKAEQKRKSEVIQEQQTIVKEEITTKNFLQKNREFENKVKNLVSDLNYIQQDGTKLSKEIDVLLKSKYLSNFQFNIKVTLSQIDEEINKIEQLLLEQNYSLSSDVAIIEKDKQQVDRQLEDYKELKNYKEQLKALTKEIEDSKNQISNHTKLLEKLPQKLEPLTQEEELLTLKIQKVEIEQKIASFEEQRKELQDGKPCPLCGSEHHPYVNLKIENKQSLSSLLADFKQHLEKIKGQINEINTQEKLLKTKIETQKNNIEKHYKRKELLGQQTINELHNKVLFKEISSLNLSELRLKAEQLKTDLQRILSVFQKVEPLKQLKNKVQNLSELRKKYKIVKDQKDSLYEGDDIVTKMNSLQTIFNESSSNVVLHQANIEQEEKLLKSNHDEFLELTKAIDVVKQKTNIDTIQDLKKAILSDDIVVKIEWEQRELNDEKTKVETLLQQTQEQFEKLNTADIQSADLIELEKQEKALKAQNEKNIGEIAKIKQQLEADKATAERKKAYQKQFEISKKEFLRWDKLWNLIGDSSGKKFSSFAQGLTLRHLIHFTNRRLKTLSGRYLIYIEPTNQELMIVDQLQGNTERSVKTLSGGESFLVSLALALSLSDMASKNVKLESLFIDEGFGTLDENTLEKAFNLLEKLQSESNKKVGVISHVKELKERISTQIQLKKNSQGHSSIVVTSFF